MTTTNDNMATFSPFMPFRDYLGLANLVARTREMARANDEDDFRYNGIDSGGLMPFTPEELRSPWGGIPYRANVANYRSRRPITWCVFCRNNGESEAVYASHRLKDARGKTTCPILQAYACPICGAKGQDAHTIKYCPLGLGNFPAPDPLRTARNSTGRRRCYQLSAVGDRDCA